VKAARDQVKEEYKVMQSQLIRKVESFENMFEMVRCSSNFSAYI